MICAANGCARSRFWPLIDGRRGERGVENSRGQGGRIVNAGKDERRARITIDEHGGQVFEFGKGKETAHAVLGINVCGNGAVSTWVKNGYRLK